MNSAFIANVVIGLVVVVIVWMRTRRRSESMAVIEQMTAMERRVIEESSRTREALERAVRDGTEAQGRLQLDSAQKLSTQFDQFQKGQTESLTAARASQDSRLDKVESSLNSLSDRLMKSFAETQKDLILQLKTMSDSNAKGALQIERKVTESLTSVGDKLTLSQNAARKELMESLAAVKKSQDESRQQLDYHLGELKTDMVKSLKESSERSLAATIALQDKVNTTLTQLGDKLSASQAEARGELNKSLDSMRKDNEEKLEKIRQAVEEKLQSTLESRLGDSFKQVSELLDKVFNRLGEMQSIATDLGDFKRVLTNVRSRGTFGEVQLGALLEQILTPSQYDQNCATVPRSSERVEYAIRLPGRDDEKSVIYLPIDAKFPKEDYERLMTAYDSNNTEVIMTERGNLRKVLLREALRIQNKYLSPPYTTDFAIMYLPTEGLYAEALRLDGIVEEMHAKARVVAVGPTTICALLNSLQMGFRTLVIQKRSSEVWKILGAVKTEFGEFGKTLEGVSKKLHEATNKIEESAKSSRAIERKLKDVEVLPAAEARLLLPEVDPGENGVPANDQ